MDAITTTRALAFEICGEYGRRKYLERDSQPGTLRMLRGSSVAEVAAENHRRQYEAKKLGLSVPISDILIASLPSEEEAQDLAASAFDRRISEGVTVAPEDVQEAGSTKLAIGRAKDVTVDMAGFYTASIAPTINPVGFEQKITIRPKDMDIAVSGILDLVEAEPPLEEGGPERELIPDLKTSERSPARGLADRDQQLTMYAMLRQAVTGKLPDAEALRFLVRTPGRGELKRVELRTKVTQGDVNALVHRLNAVNEGIRKGVFVPAAPNHWKCSSRWCEYFSTCKFALKRE